MVPHDHQHLHGHSHGHAHSHGAAVPHPAQAATWSILRLPVATVVALAAALLASSSGFAQALLEPFPPVVAFSSVTIVPGKSVLAVVGGLHLFAASDETLAWTGKSLQAYKIQYLLAGHCTGLEATYRLRQLLGLDRKTAVVSVVGSSFALGSGIAGLAGCALSQIGNVGPDLGQSYIVDSFMVVVMGGVGQLAGTVYAALGLGILNKFIEGWAGAVLAKIAVLVFLIVFIQKRPQGIFAVKGRSAEA